MIRALANDVLAEGRAGPTLNLGILGTGRISTQFGVALHESGSRAVQIVAVASRDGARAAELARLCGARRSYADYKAMLADDDVEAIYIGLPNPLHAKWTIQAAAAGRHVLCEKPLAPNLRQVRRMVEACERYDVLLMEAFPYQFQPQTIEMCRCINAGEIGSIRLLQATTGYPLSVDDAARLLPESGHGAVLDVGCYCVSLARLVFGRQPRRVSARWAAGSGSVDLTTVANIEYEDDAYAQIACSIAMPPHRNALLIGTDGVLQTSFSNHTVPESAILRIKRGVAWDATFKNLGVPSGNGFVLEAEAFARAVATRDLGVRRFFREINLDNATTLAAIMTSMRNERPVNL